ncbi:MAG: hypothetical protein ACYTDW_01390 [Planctomycetota bacterium]|jgi:hypothetical protein
MRLCVVTASTDPVKRLKYIASWKNLAVLPWRFVLVLNTPEPIVEGFHSVLGSESRVVRHKDYMGTVPAFRAGVHEAIRSFNPDVVCCFHDDLEILDRGWDAKASQIFEKWEQVAGVGLAGFGGALGAGEDNIYQADYDPMQLVRKGFISNLTDAESHGKRCTHPRRVAVLDGFSLIFSRSFLEVARPWQLLERIGVIHHAYDTAMGCVAKRYGYETWFLPVKCAHHGGQTAVGDPGYQDWARKIDTRGDAGLWQRAHKVVYEQFRDVLPFRVEEECNDE